jgi:hypothetical protein
VARLGGDIATFVHPRPLYRPLPAGTQLVLAKFGIVEASSLCKVSLVALFANIHRIPPPLYFAGNLKRSTFLYRAR